MSPGVVVVLTSCRLAGVVVVVIVVVAVVVVAIVGVVTAVAVPTSIDFGWSVSSMGPPFSYYGGPYLIGPNIVSKNVKHIGFDVCHRSYLLWSPVIVLVAMPVTAAHFD